jgi:hypothetical protein
MKQKKTKPQTAPYDRAETATQKVQNEDRLKLQAIATKCNALPKKVRDLKWAAESQVQGGAKANPCLRAPAKL